jgi:creatinine amidohydrolase
MAFHAGDIEASLMLHFRPDLVDMSRARMFPSKAVDIEKQFTHLRPIGTHAFGWIVPVLNPEDAVGDASAATASKGMLTAEFQADGFIALVRDVARFSLDDWLSTAN